MGWFRSDNTECEDRQRAKKYIDNMQEQARTICEKLEDSDTVLLKSEVDRLKSTYDNIAPLCLKYSGGLALKQQVDKVFHTVYEEACKRLREQQREMDKQKQREMGERRESTVGECPYCGEPLRTPAAKQCRVCLRDWHDAAIISRAKKSDLDEIERQKIEYEHRELLDSVTELMSSSVSPYTETMRGAVALGGAEFVSPEKMVLWDVKQLLIKLSLASSVPSNDISVGGVSVSIAVALGKLFHGIRVRVEPTTEFTLSESQAALVLGGEHLDLELPGMVRTLALYDTVEGTQLASKAALTYRSIAVTAANLCGNSFGVKLVTTAYLELLKPYIPKSSDDGGAGRSNSSSKNSGTANQRSDAMGSSYEILGVRTESTDEEVKLAYRNLAKVWHPDRFSKENDSLRDMAEKKLKEINEAYELLCKAGHGAPAASTEAPANGDVQAIVAASNSVLQKASEYNRRLDAFFARLKRGQASIDDWKEILAKQDELDGLFKSVIAKFRKDAPYMDTSALEQSLSVLASRAAHLRNLYERGRDGCDVTRELHALTARIP